MNKTYKMSALLNSLEGKNQKCLEVRAKQDIEMYQHG